MTPARHPSDAWPSWTTDLLPGGTALHHCHLPGRALAAFRILLRLGHSTTAPAGPASVLLPALTAALDARLARLGAVLDPGAGPDAVRLDVTVPLAEAPAAADLLATALRKGELPEDRVRALLDADRAAAAERAARPVEAAEAELRRLLHATDAPWPRWDADVAEVRRRAAELLRPAALQLLVAADESTAPPQAGVWSRVLDGWTGGGAPTLPPTVPAHLPPGGLRRVLPQPNDRQSVLVWGALVPVAGVREAVALETALAALGGWHGSVLHWELRERTGLSYGVRTAFEPRAGSAGGLLCQVRLTAAVQGPRTAEAERRLTEAVARFAAGPADPDTVRRTRDFLARSQAIGLQSAGQVVAEQGRLLQYGLPPDHGSHRSRLLPDLDPAEVQAAARLFHPTRTALVLAAHPANLPEATPARTTTPPGGHALRAQAPGLTIAEPTQPQAGAAALPAGHALRAQASDGPAAPPVGRSSRPQGAGREEASGGAR